MYVTFKLVNDGDCDYPENIKCFKTKEEAKSYSEISGEPVIIEEAMEVNSGFEVYQYLDITYSIGSDPVVNFKKTTSLDKSKKDIDSIYSYGDIVYVDAYVRNIRDGYRILPKILEALDTMFFNVREDENSIIHHEVGITKINKEEFFKIVRTQ